MSHPTSLVLTLAALLAAACGSGQERVDDASEAAVASDETLRAGAVPTTRPSQLVVCSGSPETISGVVVSVGTPGGGLTIEVNGALETVYGLGPSWYWSDAGLARPVVGDSVALTFSHVTTTDERVILTISVNGRELQLRDPSSCAPLWYGRRHSGIRANAMRRDRAVSPAVACNGAAFSFAGIVESVGVPGGGMTVSTGDVAQTVYGLGPVWYWRQSNFMRPAVGDAVAVIACHVTTSDEAVILSVTVNGQRMDLRDPATCAPLW
jgi:hypothetical protein